MLSRRRFLGGLVLVGCSSSSEGTSTVASSCSGASSTSSVAEDHTHELCVLASDLDAPPDPGVSYATTLTHDHAHSVVLSSTQLTNIARGTAVVVQATPTSGHTHAFFIQRPTPPPTGPY